MKFSDEEIDRVLASAKAERRVQKVLETREDRGFAHLSRSGEDDAPQWDNVRLGRLCIENPAEVAAFDDLERAWQLLEAEYGTVEVSDEERKLVDRKTIGWMGDNPMQAMAHCVTAGFYPPPELLLGLCLSWMEYLDAAGKKTLDEILVGKPKRKAGNFARRHEAEFARSWRETRLEQLLASGMSRIQAAEEITVRDKLRVDAESLLRGLRAKRSPKKRKIKGVINPVKRK